MNLNLPRGKNLFDQKHLAELEGYDCGVHAVVEDGGKILVQLHREDQLAVDVVKGPEDDADKHPDGKGSRGEDQVPRRSERLDEVCEERNDEENELEEHIEEGQVLPHTPKLVSAPGKSLRHLNPVHLVMHRPGKTRHRRELHQHRHRRLDHLCTDEGMSLGRLDTDKRLSFYHQLTKLRGPAELCGVWSGNSSRVPECG